MPKFQRISLIGSEELFRPTKREIEHEDEVFDAEMAATEEEQDVRGPADEVAGRAPAPEPAPPPAPSINNPPPPLGKHRDYYRLQLSKEQIATLIDGIQILKYPHLVRSDTKPSLEDHEYLESLRKTLLDSLD